MTEEQRYQQHIKIETERNKCLKGIWDELKEIKNLKKIELGCSPAVNSVKTIEELNFLVNAIAEPSKYMEKLSGEEDKK